MYLIQQNKIPLFITPDEQSAQEAILSLYQEYVYEGWLQQIQNGVDPQMTLTLLSMSKYGYNIYSYERIGLYE